MTQAHVDSFLGDMEESMEHMEGGTSRCNNMVSELLNESSLAADSTNVSVSKSRSLSNSPHPVTVSTDIHVGNHGDFNDTVGDQALMEIDKPGTIYVPVKLNSSQTQRNIYLELCFKDDDNGMDSGYQASDIPFSPRQGSSDSMVYASPINPVSSTHRFNSSPGRSPVNEGNGAALHDRPSLCSVSHVVHTVVISPYALSQTKKEPTQTKDGEVATALKTLPVVVNRTSVPPKSIAIETDAADATRSHNPDKGPLRSADSKQDDKDMMWTFLPDVDIKVIQKEEFEELNRISPIKVYDISGISAFSSPCPKEEYIPSQSKSTEASKRKASCDLPSLSQSAPGTSRTRISGTINSQAAKKLTFGETVKVEPKSKEKLCSRNIKKEENEKTRVEPTGIRTRKHTGRLSLIKSRGSPKLPVKNRKEGPSALLPENMEKDGPTKKDRCKKNKIHEDKTSGKTTAKPLKQKKHDKVLYCKAFTKREEQEIMKLHSKWGDKWNRIAELAGKPMGAVKTFLHRPKRYRHCKDWFLEEEVSLIQTVKDKTGFLPGGAQKDYRQLPWTQIAESLPGRSKKVCQDKWMFYLSECALLETMSARKKRKTKQSKSKL